RDWISIASIPWQLAGESSYIDPNPPGPVQYYRIHIISSDAAQFYSEIRMVKIANSGTIRLWPNPAADFVLVECPFESGYLQLMDIYGRVIWSNSISHKISSIPLAKWPAGDYIIQIRHGDQWQQIRFSKQ
ncbi:MAG TPA: T9SS type A sorting domain-containing protein, partial [Chitinophagaceae bacterium]|nr:T9SS type A sorting domain-containing protein [Chitinophagaceae bacterium]